MVVIITRLGNAQIYNQGVGSVFILTGLNKHSTNNKSKNNNKKWNATHERENVYHKGTWDIGGVNPFTLNLHVRL